MTRTKKDRWVNCGIGKWFKETRKHKFHILKALFRCYADQKLGNRFFLNYKTQYKILPQCFL